MQKDIFCPLGIAPGEEAETIGIKHFKIGPAQPLDLRNGLAIQNGPERRVLVQSRLGKGLHRDLDALFQLLGHVRAAESLKIHGLVPFVMPILFGSPYAGSHRNRVT